MRPVSASLDLLPHMHPHIRISPFIAQEWEKLLSAKISRSSRSTMAPAFWLNKAKDMQFFDSGRSALEGCLLNLHLKRSDEVLIIKNTDGPYISSCVTRTIEKVCRWSQKPSARTKVVLVIHEFGFSCPAGRVAAYKNKGIPIIEDCAYALGSRTEGANIGTLGDFAIYSLAKYYPVPFGGILASRTKLKPPAATLKLTASDENILRHTIQAAHPLMHKWNTARRQNWERFAYELANTGAAPYFALTRSTVPGAYVAAVPSRFRGEAVKTKMTAAGIESTQYYHQGGFYFPVHQFLTIWEKDYIVRHFA